MFKLTGIDSQPHITDQLETNIGLAAVADTLQLGAEAVDVTLECYETKMLSSTAGAQYNLPSGEYVGQRKLLSCDVSGSGTCVASASSLSKLLARTHYGETPASSVTALTFDADAEKALLEWDGAKWNILYAIGGVTVTVT